MEAEIWIILNFIFNVIQLQVCDWNEDKRFIPNLQRMKSIIF